MPSHRVQATLFAFLLIAFILSGIFELLGNLAGDRINNIDSTAPFYLKIGKELALILIVVVVIFSRRGRIRVSRFNLGFIAILLALMIPAVLFLRDDIAAQVGFLYLIASLAMCLLFALVSPDINPEFFYRWFLAPAIFLILASQLIEIRYAPSSFYHETTLFGLDRRAGIAVIPTTAGCIAVLCGARARGIVFAATLMVLVIANSTLAWCAAFLVWTARLRKFSRIILIAPALMAAITIIIMSRSGLTESAGTRIALLAKSMSELHVWIPSDIGAGATAKAVALSSTYSFIADSTPLEFFHVFGVVPGLLIYFAIIVLIARRAGLRAATIFFGVSIGFLFIESWVLTASLIWVMSHPNTYVKHRFTHRGIPSCSQNPSIRT